MCSPVGEAKQKIEAGQNELWCAVGGPCSSHVVMLQVLFPTNKEHTSTKARSRAVRAFKHDRAALELRGSSGAMIESTDLASSFTSRRHGPRLRKHHLAPRLVRPLCGASSRPSRRQDGTRPTTCVDRDSQVTELCCYTTWQNDSPRGNNPLRSQDSSNATVRAPALVKSLTPQPCPYLSGRLYAEIID